MSPARLTRRGTLLLALAGVLVIALAAVLIAGWVAPVRQQAPQLTATAGATSLATSLATGQSQELSGGDLGDRIPFATGNGNGWLSITAAKWTTDGETAPPPGKRYLIITVDIECSKGSLAVDGLWLRAKTSSGWTGPSYGPRLTQPLTHHQLTAGSRVTGQVGFTLPAGAATIGLLDESLASVAERELSAP